MLKDKSSKSKGQFLLVSLIASVMVIFAFVTIYPILKQAIATAVPTMDVYSATLLQLTPFFIILAVVLSIVFAAFPVRE